MMQSRRRSGDRFGRSRWRTGHTLIELIVSLGVASVLLVGLSSAMFVGLRAADRSRSPAIATLDAHEALGNMMTDLQFALSITEQAATAITVTVPDRDGDLAPETIRYCWSATIGDPLTREYNGGPEKLVVADVHDFGIEYFQPGTSVEYLTVWLQPTTRSDASIETAIPLLNAP